MSKQLYQVGDVIQAGSNPLEVTGVSYQEVDGEKVKYSYNVRLHAELENERAEEAQAQKAQEVAEKENAKLTPVAKSDDEPVDHNEGAED
jgi:hypothetical protein